MSKLKIAEAVDSHGRKMGDGKMNDILEQIACGFVGALLGYLLVEVFFPIPKGM